MDEQRNTTAIDRAVNALTSRRAVVGGIGALSLAIGSGPDGVFGRTRAKRRRRRRRGGGGVGVDSCDVCPSGCAYRTIQDAIDNAPDDEGEVFVCAGTFKERITINGAFAQNLSIIGAGLENTVIDADGDGTAVTILRDTFATIEGVAITGGKAALGGGIVNRGILTLHDCAVTDNSNGAADGGGGGGIYNAPGARLTMNLVTVSRNNALDGQGGGIFNAGGTVALQESSQVAKNMADQGGGIFNQAGGTVTVEDSSSVTGNEPDNCVGTTAC